MGEDQNHPHRRFDPRLRAQPQARSTGGWQTRKRADGRTEWIPPPDLDYGQPRVNMFHHPEELLRDDDP
ncbi:hypothetical protein I553_7839 [Mycobacterium xenopi 4042]|uniref:Uncharacterized protein n=1 Tax=Mycobacterium xenopi 4042 TaxID=1299334 RepID=X8AQW5_MYCXE|nr:hypothetical protein I553_7839 [Mycobacterium xenopi 4042]